MKMAKASKADIEMALTLCSALEAIDRRFFPEGSEGDNDPDDLDLDNDEHCGHALRRIAAILEGGSIGRVIWGMYVVMDPANKIIAPDAETLELHPEFEHTEADAERYRWLRNMMFRNDTGHLDLGGEIVCNWNAPNAGEIDRAIDAAMAAANDTGNGPSA